jgi:hypothetical protein
LSCPTSVMTPCVRSRTTAPHAQLDEVPRRPLVRRRRDQWALNVVGLAGAWIPIFVGVLLWQAAGALTDGYPSDADLLRRASERLRHLFMTNAVLAVVALVRSFMLLGLGLIAAIAEVL